MSFSPQIPNVPQAKNWQNTYAPGAPAPVPQPWANTPNGQPYQQPVPQPNMAQQLQQTGPTSGDVWSILRGQYGPQSAQMDLIGQQLGIDQRNSTQMVGLQKNQLQDQTQITINRANKMIENAGLTAAHARAGEGFVKQLYGVQNTQAGLQYGSQRAALLSDSTARGAVNAHGTVGQFKNQYEAFQNQLAGNLINKNQSISDLKLQENQAANLAQQFGLDKVALIDRLHNGLAQLGLQGQVDAGMILKAIYSNDANKAGIAQNLVQSFVGIAQNNPSILTNQAPTPTQPLGSIPSPSFQGGGGRVM